MKHNLLVSIGGILMLALAGCCCLSDKEMSQVFDAHRIFGTHMVLQQGKPIVFSGKAEPGKYVCVKFAGKKVCAKAAKNGEWEAAFAPMKAGGPYTVEITGKKSANKITFSDVLIGEVWICSGQSNMEMPVASSSPFWRTKNYKEEVKNANHPKLRIYHGKHRVSPQVIQQEPLGTGWEVCTPDSIQKFSAAGYFFGRQLLQDLKVPIGMIHVSWGGTRIEAWISGKAYIDNKRPEVAKIKVAASSDYEKELKKLIASEKKRLANWFKVFDSELAKAKFNGASLKLNDSKWAFSEDGLSFPADQIGTIWFRKTVELPAAAAGKEMQLELGVIDDCDETFFNGVLIGKTDRNVAEYWKRNRKYKVPGKLVKAGKNVIAVRAFNYYGPGGFSGERTLSAKGLKAINLTNGWKAKTEYTMNTAKHGTRQDVAASISPKGFSHPSFPTTLYNGMAAPWTRYAIRGAIWYQGCSNAGSMDYYPLHKMLIQDWRRAWKDPAMPFIITQLAGFQKHTPKNRLKDDYWKTIAPTNAGYALTREIQAEMLRIPNTGLAVAIDIGDHSDIHPRDKQTLGFRLAREAERIAYGYKGITRGPEFKSMKIEGNKIRVKFSNVGKGLTTADGKAPGAFAIAGKNGRFVWAQTRIEGNDVIVWSPAVKNPVNVRYAYVQFRGDVNLKNKDGFPALPFRTDKPVYK